MSVAKDAFTGAPPTRVFKLPPPLVLIQMGSYQLGGFFLIEIKDLVDYGFGYHEYRNIGLGPLILLDIPLQDADLVQHFGRFFTKLC